MNEIIVRGIAEAATDRVHELDRGLGEDLSPPLIVVELAGKPYAIPEPIVEHITQLEQRLRSADCDHYWLPNNGTGGQPRFSLSLSAPHRPATMMAKCAKCAARWDFTTEQWQAIPAAAAPSVVRA